MERYGGKPIEAKQATPKQIDVLKRIYYSGKDGVTYKELKRGTGLSDYSLTEILNRWHQTGVIERGWDKKYRAIEIAHDVLYFHDLADFVATDAKKRILIQHELLEEWRAANGTSVWISPQAIFSEGGEKEEGEEGEEGKSKKPAVLYPLWCYFTRPYLVTDEPSVFVPLANDEEFRKAIGYLQYRVFSQWVSHRTEEYARGDGKKREELEKVKEYEEALAKYLALFDGRLVRYTIGPRNELRFDREKERVLDLLVDWEFNLDRELEGYKQFTVEWLNNRNEVRRKAFSREDAAAGGTGRRRDALETIRTGEYERLRGIVYDREKIELYKKFLKILTPPPRSTMIVDAGMGYRSLLKGRKASVVQYLSQRDILGAIHPSPSSPSLPAPSTAQPGLSDRKDEKRGSF